MRLHEEHLHPRNEMVLKGAFDQLVQNVRGEQLVNVGAWKIIRKRLRTE